MSSVIIEGGNPLYGEVCVQGSKNAVLPILAAVVLTDGITKLIGCPKISDVDCILSILNELGCKTSFLENILTIDTTGIDLKEIAKSKAEQTRASILLLGAFLGRFRKAVLSYPGGCTIGSRPVDLHLFSLKKMGAVIQEEEDFLLCHAPKLNGTEIVLSFPSVGATENTILAAVLADGITTISNAAREPEISALCQFLRRTGANIKGDGTEQIVIEGVKKLRGCEYLLPYDRIVAGTYLTAVAAAGGDAVIYGVAKQEQQALLELLEQCGCILRFEEEVCCIKRTKRLKGIRAVTQPFPGFPTDMQSQVLSMLSMAEGESQLEEKIFEARFQTCKELKKMGANLLVTGNRVDIYGVACLHGTKVKAYDLRGGAGLCIAGLMAQGSTTVEGMEFTKRGYEEIVRDLLGLGAKIRWS